MTVDDIEDLTKIVGNGVKNGYDYSIKVNPRYRKEDLENDGEYSSFLPGKHRIYVKTWGCTHNSSDSEYMSGILHQNGYLIVNTPDEADLWILNSCTVKNPAEDHFRNEIRNARKLEKKLIVAGCVPQSDYKSSYLKDISIIGVQQTDKVVEVVEETLKGNVVHFLKMKKDGKRKAGGPSLHMPKIRRNPLIEIIAINTGCLNRCTYCKTKHARGDLGSYHIEEIVERAQVAFAEGVKELWITSEDTGAYGRDIGTNLPELLRCLIKVIPKGCMLRLGMTNPPYIREHLEAMAEILNHPRVYSFLHIPIQSGSDPVLADMKREYCVQDFCDIVDFLQERVKGITIATDIICGFPTETEENFNETVQLVQLYQFPVLFINQFYPRPGTPAAKMKRIPTQEVKRRSKVITDIFNSYSPYVDRIGQRYQVLVTEESSDRKHYVGHNKYYEQILIEQSECQLGDYLEVIITTYGKHYMIGQVVKSWLPKTIITDGWIPTSIGLLTLLLVYKVYKHL